MQIITYKFWQLLYGVSGKSVFTLLITLLLISAQAVAQDAPSRTAESQAPAVAGKGEGGQSTIRGRVVFDDTGRPVRRASVMLFTNLKHPAVRRTVTNRRGEFRFGRLEAGSYFVVADAPGMVSPSSGFQISELGPVSEGIDEDQIAVSVEARKETQTEIRIRKGGAISGKITYGDNEPVLGGRVILYRRRGTGSARFFTNPVLTDDRGVYRIEGLPAGDYLVGVVEKNAGDDKILLGERPAIVAAYYPGAKGLQDARVVQVMAGSETRDVNIKLAEENLRRISGKVVWRAAGQPAARATVILQRRDDPGLDVSLLDLIQNTTAPGSDKTSNMMRTMSLAMLMMGTTPSMETDAKGDWRFTDIPSGTYMLTTVASLPVKESESTSDDEKSEPDKRAAASERRLVTQRLEVTVSDNDEADIKIELSEGGRISGLVETEDGPLPYARLMLDYEGAHPVLNLPYYTNPDGTFLLEGVPAGEVRLDVRLPAGTAHYVKSMTAAGVDLLRTPLRINDGVELSGVRITLARGVATLSGRIMASEQGVPVAGAGILLVPVDEKLWPVRSARIFGRSDTEGTYSVSGAPGDYLVLVWSPKNEPAQSIAEYIRLRFATAPRISLQLNETKKADLLLNALSPGR